MVKPQNISSFRNESRSAGGRSGLEPSWYLSTRVFQTEKERLFSKSWIPVGYTTNLESSGDFFRAFIHDCDSIVIRDQQGQIKAFQNVCRHRGTQLCAESRGKLKSAMVCPYHGWKYDFQGRLISAPTMQSVEGFDTGNYGLVEFAVANWNGLLWASHREAELPLPIAALDGMVKAYPLDQYRLQRSLTYEVRANWKLIFQNFNECYHCPSVHPQLTPLTDHRDSINDFESGAVLGGPMRIRDTVETISRDGKYCGQPPSGLPEKEFRNARYYTVFPHLFFSLFPDYVMIHRLHPVAQDHTRITCDFLFHRETIATGNFHPEHAIEFWDLTNQQDWEMCERVQIGVATPGFRPSPYSDQESLLAAFDLHYLDQMASVNAGLPG